MQHRRRGDGVGERRVRVFETLVLGQLGRGPTHGGFLRGVVAAVEAFQLFLRFQQFQEIRDIIVIRLDLTRTATLAFIEHIRAALQRGRYTNLAAAQIVILGLATTASGETIPPMTEATAVLNRSRSW